MESMKAFLLRGLNFVATHHYIKALQKSMVSVIGISFIAGILMIVQNPPLTHLTENAFTEGWVTFATDNAGLLALGIQLTLGMIGVYTLVAFILTLAHHYQLNPFHPLVSGLIAYLLLSVGFTWDASGLALDLAFLGYSGVFVAFFLGILTVEFHRFSIFVRSHFQPKTEIQERLAQPIEASLATLILIALAFACRYALSLNGILLPDLVLNFLTPLLQSSDTILFVLTVIVLSKLLWFIGMDGNSLILLSLMPMMVVFNAENLLAYQNDKALPYIFATGFLFFELGVLPLVTAILLFSKNKSHRSSAKLGLLPSIFNFPETMIAGLPLTFNGAYLIPFVLSSVLSLSGAYAAMTLYWVNKPLFAFSPALPGFLGAFLSTVDWKAIVLWFGLYVVCTLIYWPFIRQLNKKITKVEIVLEEAPVTTVVE